MWRSHLVVEFLSNFILLALTILLAYYYYKNRKALSALRTFFNRGSSELPGTTLFSNAIKGMLRPDTGPAGTSWNFNSDQEIPRDLLDELLGSTDSPSVANPEPDQPQPSSNPASVSPAPTSQTEEQQQQQHNKTAEPKHRASKGSSDAPPESMSLSPASIAHIQRVLDKQISPELVRTVAENLFQQPPRIRRRK